MEIFSMININDILSPKILAQIGGKHKYTLYELFVEYTL